MCPLLANVCMTNYPGREKPETKRAVEEEYCDKYGALPARMRVVVLPISTFGAIGTGPGHTFIGELSRRMRASVAPTPSFLPHASWATPRVSPMIRTTLTVMPSAPRPAWRHRSIHANWRCGDGGSGGGAE